MMKKRSEKIFLTVLLFLWVIGAFWFLFRLKSFDSQDKIEEIKVGVQIDRLNQPDLVMAFPKEKKTEIFEGKQVLGGVVPHHLVAASSLAEFFSALSRSLIPPETVIIIGPNHNEQGKGRIITGKYAWDTTFGKLETDAELVDKLVNDGRAVIDEELLSDEHAIYSLIPFVKYFLPNAKIVPVVLSATLSMDEAQALGKKIAQISGANVAAVGSIDFSHYLSTEVSDRMDQETMDAMQKRDYRLLESYGNDHLDSPDALLAVMSFVEEKSVGKYSLEMVRHTNSGSILGKENAPGTSHFELGFVLAR